MEREEVLAERREASTPQETAEAIYDARVWLAKHPNDHRVESEMEDFLEVQRESLGSL
jgi:hypothetical protein